MRVLKNLISGFPVILTVISLSVLVLLAASCAKAPSATGEASSATGVIKPAGGLEAVEFQGQKLTPLKDQGNNALAGTQHIDKTTYHLTVDGLVNSPLSLSYSDLEALPQVSKLNTLNCVEGWNFVAKWTGPSLYDIFVRAGINPEAKIAIFYSTDVPDGYSSLEVSYIQSRDIIIALRINDLTIPDERGFPFQVMAENKYGYKWAKWINRIELSSNTSFRGYWEQGGFSNNADVGGPSLER
jgi:DMSO/TMAO reductase YedYZ molybdopterin-dependent catalytic subunit